LPACVSAFRNALRTIRDDFSEVVVRSNLAIACWKSADLDSALAQVDPVAQILAAPQFTDRHIFWPVCYNIAQILKAAQMEERARLILAMPEATGRIDELNPHQWKFRYGKIDTPDPRTPYLHDFDYYPLFLIHWQIDREVLVRLNEGPAL